MGGKTNILHFIELFGRPHNTYPGWLTLGNQLSGIQLHDSIFREKILRHLAVEKHIT